jgi:tetratricopeptide (TPR) repeat protein
MSETNSLNTADDITGRSHSADTASAKTLDAVGHVFLERIGVGGMGEVYRCADDALGRDLAIKVLRAELRGDAGAEERFLREARLTGSLQHPGIVPVHHLGRLADRRPCYTMKLVRGRTLADLLREEPAGPERLPRLLDVVEKVCQAVAFAHSKGILHRDLKPSNIMVGEFGEVQVMDWGLAKQLSHAEPAPPPGEATEEVETVGRVEEAEGLSRAGAALGTPAYMPPEQAAGDWDIVDERADVFALGAILCEMLTGRPPYYGANRDDLLRRARRGDLAEALGRLERGGADAELVNLCRLCLAAAREDRPRNAAIVAERVAAYEAEVQERLRQAELERVAAQTRAQEEQARALVERERTREALARVAAERRARRLTRVLSAALLLAVTAAGAVGLWYQQQRADRRAELALRQLDTERDVAAALRESAALAAQADKLSDDPLRWEASLRAARSAALRAEFQARTGEATDELRERVTAALAELERAERGRQLVADLDYIRLSQSEAKEGEFARRAAVPRYAAAFGTWGLDVDRAEPTVLAERVRRHGQRERLLAAIRDWAKLTADDGERGRLTALLSAAEPAPDDFGQRLREALAKPGTMALVRLAETADDSRLSTTTLVQLARDLRHRGEAEAALQLLLRVQERHPSDFWLNHELGFAFKEQKPARWEEVVRYFTAAVALRPSNSVVYLNLGKALRAKGDVEGAIRICGRAIELDPKFASPHYDLGAILCDDKRDYDRAIACFRRALELDPRLVLAHLSLGNALRKKGDLDGAIACYKKALELDPKYALAHLNLGNALREKGDLDCAIAYHKRALELDPKDAVAHNNLGNALYAKHDLDCAIACYQKALELDPKYPLAHNNLGNALYAKHDLDGAIACHKRALELDPKYAEAHYNLGNTLLDKGDLDGAIACYKKALELDPKYAEAHCNLGNILKQQGRFAAAVASYRRGHELGSKRLDWRYPSARWLRDAERILVLDKKLPAILSGEAAAANPGDAITLAQVCQEFKKRHVAAARLYADVFAAEPKLAADLDAQHRYNAACSAALAAAGHGEDAHLLPDKVVVMFRSWALGWLRDDLTAYAKLAGQNNSAIKQTIQQGLTHWRSDPDLASLRDPQSLNRLPDNERAAWQELWRDVDQLAKRAAKQNEPTQGHEEPQTLKAKP